MTNIFFFFSSRRRHTRFDCDWSSDVCSSDLRREPFGCQPGRVLALRRGWIASRSLPCAKNGWPESVYIETSAGRTPNRIVMAASITLVVVVWAINFIAAKIGLRYLPPLTMASFRVTLAGLSMVPAYLICSRWPAFADARRSSSQGITLRDLWTFSYLGFFGVVVNQMCFTMGLRDTSVSHAAVIVGMGPIYT